MKWECAVKKCQLTSLTWVFGLCKYTFKVFASIMKYASSGSRALKMASVAEAGVVVQDANALLLHLLLLLHSVWAIKGVGAETPRKSTNATWLLQSLLLLLKNSKGDKTVFSCSVVPLSLLPLETGRTWDPILWSLVEVHSITSLDLKKKKPLELLDSESCGTLPSFLKVLKLSYVVETGTLCLKFKATYQLG